MLTEFLPQKLRTFSIGFGDGGFDESSFAAEVARSIGTDHTELRATPRDALAIVPSLPSLFGEPFADVSQIPSLLLARLARPHVTVALTGDGGDEIFAGYNRYLFLERARAIPSASAPILGALAAFAGNFSGLERALRLPQISEKLEKLAMVSRAGSATDAYWALAAQGLQAAKGYAPVENASAAFSGVPGQQLRDQLLYLPDDILVKVDRAAMASSLETRAPLIDARLVELAWRLPLHLRTANGQGKIMLRRLLAKRVPPALWQRPKAGFTPPVGSWLRGELRPWAEELLSDRALKDTGLPGAEAVKRQWTQTRKSGRGALRLWPALMAQAWLKSEL